MKIYNNYPMIDRIRALETFRAPKYVILKIIIFVAAFFAAQIVESFGMVFGVMPMLFAWATGEMEANGGKLNSSQVMEKLNSLLADPRYTYIMLFATGLATLTIFAYCRFVEGRKLGTLGFKKKGGLAQYLIGLFVGMLLFSLIVLISWAMGGLEWHGFKGGSILSILLVFLGFGIQGMSEEVICRGFYMTTTLRHQNVWWAVGINSVLFGLFHSANSGFSILALVNLILFGVTASLYMLRTDNIWGVCAIHSIWNFVQGNFYGLPVSGIDSGATVFSMSLKNTSAIINGGDFGLEASIATTIVLGAAIAVLLFVPLPFAVNETRAKAAEVPQEPQA